jgi:hypothetical protein
MMNSQECRIRTVSDRQVTLRVAKKGGKLVVIPRNLLDSVDRYVRHIRCLERELNTRSSSSVLL